VADVTRSGFVDAGPFYNLRHRHCYSATSRQRRSSKGLSIPAHTILPPCSRPSRSGLEALSQAAPTACRPSLTAAPLGGQRNLQAGTER
jgi:hypothetical protein